MNRVWYKCALLVLLSQMLRGAPIPLHCWVVRFEDESSNWTTDQISNQVNRANALFSQVAMSFELASINFTNDTSLVSISYTNTAQQVAVCGIANGTGGLEVYFVEEVKDGAVAFQNPSGIVIGHRLLSQNILAHELGHACGLDDIYDVHAETDLLVLGRPDVSRLTHDWGWYPDHVFQVDIIRRLLMYGYTSENNADISRGDIYGLWCQYTLNDEGTAWNKSWQLSNAPVGFKLHGNRHPVSE